MDNKKKVAPEEAAKLLIGSFKQFMKGKTLNCRCPSGNTLFFKFLVDRQLIEVKCYKCTKRWNKLKNRGYKKSKSFIFHRYDVKMKHVETVIVDGNTEKNIERM